MLIALYLLALYILTKPFYLWESGLPQISDIILVVAFIIAIISVEKKLLRSIIFENKYFFIFLIFVVIINVIYSIYYIDGSFLLHGLYYVFDALGIVTFIIIFKMEPRFNKTFSRTFKLSLLIQLLIFVLHLGRYYSESRYMGTFNDPNQFAYYCFLSYGFIYLLDRNKNRLFSFCFFVLTLFLIFESGSTGMLAGISVFLVFYCIRAIKHIIANLRRYLFPMIIVGLLVLCGVCIMSINANNDNFDFDLADNQTIARVLEKISKAEGNEEMSLWQERGYDRMVFYPEYLLYGAGEGAFWRFEKAYHRQEFHATLPSILFCYGIIPTCFVLLWFFQKLKGKNMETLCILLALLAESFTLINSRQVLFWVIFVVVDYLPSKTQVGNNLAIIEEGDLQ